MLQHGCHMIIYDDSFFCNFVKIGDRFECSKCGITVTVADEYDDIPIWPCNNPLLSENVGNSVSNFALLSSEGELASSEIINQRHSICSNCEHFINHSCEKCGCSITRNRDYMNKLASTENGCPIGKW